MEPIKCTMWEKTDREMAVHHRDEDGSPASWTPWYRNVETGEEVPGFELPIGAMRDQAGLSDRFKERAGADGRYIVVRIPSTHGGIDWYIDGRASNCGRPDDNLHRCWVRHGEPPNITVDKNGDTCDAGAGSIAVDGFHGFLRDGHLVDC